MSTSKIARGLRNNNPLNIIKSANVNWQGQVNSGRDKTVSDLPGMSTSAGGC